MRRSSPRRSSSRSRRGSCARRARPRSRGRRTFRATGLPSMRTVASTRSLPPASFAAITIVGIRASTSLSPLGAVTLDDLGAILVRAPQDQIAPGRPELAGVAQLLCAGSPPRRTAVASAFAGALTSIVVIATIAKGLARRFIGNASRTDPPRPAGVAHEPLLRSPLGREERRQPLAHFGAPVGSQ